MKGIQRVLHCNGINNPVSYTHLDVYKRQVRTLAGPTNGRLAAPGTIRGDYSMSFQENIVHTSDSPETAAIELTRFFKPEEIFDYKEATFDSVSYTHLYAHSTKWRMREAETSI